MLGHRWWSVPELRATDQVVYPEALADLLERLLDPEDRSVGYSLSHLPPATQAVKKNSFGE